MSDQVGQQGWGQATAAMQSLYRTGLGMVRSRASSRRKRASGTRKNGSRKRASKSAKRSGGSKLKRLVKGSAAAKAYMAKIRRKRK